MKNIHVVGIPRSGSTHMSNAISNHAQGYSSFFEPFNPGDTGSIETIQDNILTSNNSNNLVIKSHETHLRHLATCDLLSQLNYNEWYNILLIRTNLVETMLSLAVSDATGQWDTYYSHDPITITYRKLFMYASSIVAQLDSLFENQYHIRYDAVHMYETLPKDTWGLFQKINIPDVTVNQIGQGTPPVQFANAKSQTIANFEQAVTMSNNILAAQSPKHMTIKNGIITAFSLATHTCPILS